MIPKKNNYENTEYEKVRIDDWTVGVISDVEQDEHHKVNFQGKESEKDCVRLRFLLDGYKMPHMTNWMTFSYGEKSNLYNKYLSKLVEGMTPDANFDLIRIKGMRVKIMWAERLGTNGKTYQHVDTIRPEKDKIKFGYEPVVSSEMEPTEPDTSEAHEDLPF